jgi:phosphate transport system permease protein
VSAIPLPAAESRAPRRPWADRIGDRLLKGLTVAAALLAVIAMGAITYKIIDGASPSISKLGLGFLTAKVWNPVTGAFGASAFIFGTAVTSFLALLIATPLAVAIGLYLSMLAPRRAKALIGPLVEMLAAIPSVVLGLWGIIVLAPFLSHNLEHWLHDVFGFIPLFGTPSTTGTDIFTASLILTIMMVPIIASISRELFSSVPAELKDGALALGTTRWEMVRGVVLASSRPGIAAAAILGLGRALGEAIAVTQVIGNAGGAPAIHASLFAGGDTLASRIAAQFQGATSNLEISSFFYLALILLVIGLLANVAAQLIVRRYELPGRGR